jgi:hypothetical protein
MIIFWSYYTESSKEQILELEKSVATQKDEIDKLESSLILYIVGESDMDDWQQYSRISVTAWKQDCSSSNNILLELQDLLYKI